MKKVEIFIKNMLLNIFLVFIKNRRLSDKINPGTIKKVLVLRLNKIGDALVTTPLLGTLANSTGYQVDVLVSQANSFIFSNNDSVTNIYVFQKSLASFFDIIKKLNSNKYDLIIDAHDDLSTTITIFLTFIQAKYKIGFEKKTKKLYTHSVVKPDAQTTHIVDRILSLASPLGLNLKNSSVYYKITEKSADLAKSYFSQFENRYVIGINISAGHMDRFWGVENFKKLIVFLQKYDCKVLILCSPDYYSLAKEIANEEISIYHSKSFNEFSAIVQRLNFLFTPDTSVVHLAAAYSVPVFGLYVHYNTTDMIWTPYKTDNEYVTTEDPNLNNLDSELVINKLKPFFEKKYYEYSNSRL